MGENNYRERQRTHRCNECGSIEWDHSTLDVLHRETSFRPTAQEIQRRCAVCGGGFDISMNEFMHACDCPSKGGFAAAAPLKVRQPDPEYFEKTVRETPFRVSSLGAKRFEKQTHPMKVNPADALDAARAWIEAGNDATHILIVIGTKLNDGGDVQTKFFQAGNYDVHGQIGLSARMTDALIHGERS